MSFHRHPLDDLRKFLPPDSFGLVVPLLHQYKVQLSITNERHTKLGDYRRKGRQGSHRISVNGNLNPYNFLVTLLHELAHLLVNEVHGWHVAPHGKEWKRIYGQLLKEFLEHRIFPADIALELQSMLHNPGASSCSEDGLQRIMFRYDANPQGLVLLEDLATGSHFVFQGKRRFQKGEVMRKRILCTEWPGGKAYLFSPLAQVQPLSA